MSHDVFICYAARDKPIADSICAVLEAEGVRCWIAPRDILPGADWGESIIDAINDARAMVLVFSSNANDAQSQIKREVERGVNKGIPVIPFRIENVMPTKSLEYFLSKPHWLDAFTPPLDGHVRQLADSIKRLLGQTVKERPILTPFAQPSIPNLPHHARAPIDLKDIRIGGKPVLEWAKEPVHAAMLAGAGLVLLLALWFVFRPTATPEDQNAWNVAAMEDSIPAYQLYMREMPDGYFYSRADKRATELKTEVDDAFAKAKAANTPAAYTSFMETYAKQGLDLDEARAAYENANALESNARNAYRRATATRTHDGYQAFLAEFGNTAYAADVRQRMAACHTETRTTGNTESHELEHSGTDTASDPNEACNAARNNAVSNIESQCSASNGRMGAIRTLNQHYQQASSNAGRIAGSVLGQTLFGNSRSMDMGSSSYQCSVEVEVSCEKTVSSARPVDVCP